MITPIKLTDDGSHTLESARYSQTYHSINGAFTEARHVFLDASGVSKRLQQGLSTNVLEIGFGVGLNTLLTADLATLHGAPLNYHTYEHDLPAANIIRQLRYGELLVAPELFKALLLLVEQAADRTPHRSASYSGTLTETVHAHLHLKDATSTCFKTDCSTLFHAIYLDAFSADANPECWSPEFIARLSKTLALDGRLSTYSARGHVRRAMLAAGLKVEKMPGPPGKREMLVGYW